MQLGKWNIILNNKFSGEVIPWGCYYTKILVRYTYLLTYSMEQGPS